ncbi:MAG: hypothetical protein M3433_02195 [Actinomycetota bacterium]|nr:hypothetical protein [Actinomycetota bacterium]
MTALDDIAGTVELILVPVSLGLLVAACGLGEVRIPWPRRTVARAAAALGVAALLFFSLYIPNLFALVALSVAVRLVARFAATRPASWRLAIPLAALTALTVAQPFGVRPSELVGTAAKARASPADSAGRHAIEILGVPIMRFVLYRKPIKRLGLGECCPPTHTLRVRSWVTPAFMTSASDVTPLKGDGAPSMWALEGSEADRRVRASFPSDCPDAAWRLSATVVSGWGVVFWICAAIGIAAVVRRRKAA